MKTLALFIALLFSSCHQTALSPLTNANGTPVMIQVDGVRSATDLKKSTQMAIIETLSQKCNSPEKLQRYFPEQDVRQIQAECSVVILFGNCQLKNGKQFVGVTPAVGIRAMAPQADVTQAARSAAADASKLALSNYKVQSINDLKKWQKKSE